MQTLEHMLRQEFTRDDATIKVDVGPMIQRVHAVRRRRAAIVATAGTVVAALVAAGVGWSVVNRDTLLGYKNMTKFGNVEFLFFTDQDTGYQLRDDCQIPTEDLAADNPTHISCQAALLATADSGRTWQRRTLPANDRIPYWFQRLGPDPNTLLLSEQGGSRTWISRDGGRAWRQGGYQSSAEVEVIPSSGLLSYGSLPNSPVEGSRLWAVGSDGNAAPLATAPAGVSLVETSAVGPAEDGSYWLPCVTATRRPCAAVTTDRGRTWRVAGPEASGTVADVRTLDGRSIYLGVADDGRDRSSQPTPPRDAPVAGPATPDTRPWNRPFRSVDGGQTWQEIASPDTFRGINDLEALPDGGALAEVAGALYRLSGGGTMFEPVSGAPHGTLRRSGPWLLVTSTESLDTHMGDFPIRYSVYKSLDGIDWTKIQMP